jgi:hypothetical protein
VKFRPWLTPHHTGHAALTEALLREVWEFRRGFLDFAPDVDLEAAFRNFTRFFGPNSELVLYRDRDGAIQGMWGWKVRVYEAQGRRHAVFDGEYFYVSPSARGNFVQTRVTLRTFVVMLLRHGSVRGVSAVGTGFPPSFMAVARYAHRYRCLLDDDTWAWERQAIRDRLAETPGADPVTGHVHYSFVSREGRKRPTTAFGREFLAWFEGHAPAWPEGTGMAVIMHVSPASLLRGILRAAWRR